MFLILLLHVAYAVLMFVFSFRIMVIPHAIVIAFLGVSMIFSKGLIIAPILSFIYALFAIALALADNAEWEDGTGNEFIWVWVWLCTTLGFIITEWLI